MRHTHDQTLSSQCKAEHEPISEHPHCALPAHFFERVTGCAGPSGGAEPGRVPPGALKRTLFSIHAWNGRPVMSVET